MKTKNLTHLITDSAFVMILLISCNGCRSGRVPEKQDVSFSQPDSQKLMSVQDTNKYLFQDDPVLRKLKLTRIPKEEAIAELDENGTV
ncbi:MAG: hypothetical protein IPL63_00770 [Saprospiraceae bacterium]|nr:hypothetical protein [Saprospiraceae bacterium]